MRKELQKLVFSKKFSKYWYIDCDNFHIIAFESQLDGNLFAFKWKTIKMIGG